jgi:hypothetical protein
MSVPSIAIPSTSPPPTLIPPTVSAPLDTAPIAPAPKRIATPSAIPNVTWTPERIAQLRSCVEAGMTCSEIGIAIGVTRNAVIGKIHRLGLSSGRPAGLGAHKLPSARAALAGTDAAPALTAGLCPSRDRRNAAGYFGHQCASVLARRHRCAAMSLADRRPGVDELSVLRQ